MVSNYQERLHGGGHQSLIKFWIAEVFTALEYIHSQGIVHRKTNPKKPEFAFSMYPGNLYLMISISCRMST